MTRLPPDASRLNTSGFAIRHKQADTEGLEGNIWGHDPPLPKLSWLNETPTKYHGCKLFFYSSSNW